jgi:hypothetical protein
MTGLHGRFTAPKPLAFNLEMAMCFDLEDEIRSVLTPLPYSPPPKAKPRGVAMDAANTDVAPVGAGDYAAKDIALKAVAALNSWVETDDLDAGETLADRLFAMAVGIADANHDGEITEDEQEVMDGALEAMWQYLESKGCTAEDCNLLLNEWDPDAAERIRELLASNLPDGEDAELAELDNFVFGDEAEQPAMDSATYKKTFAIRSGKKKLIRKRVSGTVRLSPKQKVAIRKAVMRSHSAGAQARRTKSMKMRAKFGLGG